MPVIKKTLFDEKLEKVNVLVNDTDPNSKYFKITELNDTFTGGKNAFLIQGSEYLVPDTIIKIQIKDANGDTIYYEPGEGIVSSSVNGESFVSEYYEGTSKVVSVYIYPNKTIDANGNPLDGTAFGPATITILGELKEYESDGLIMPIPSNWTDTYNVKWTKTVNVNPLLPNVTKIRFYKRPSATITEILQPLYTIVGDTKVASSVTQSFADIKLSNLETFAGDVKRVKVFRTSQGDISDYDLIQDVLLESKELLTTYGLSGSVVGNTGIFTSETLQKYWNTGSLTAELTSSRVESGLKLSGSGIFRYTSSLDINSANTYELNLDAFYSGSVNSNLGIYLSSGSVSSSIGTLYGISPTKNLKDTVIPFTIASNYPSASLYFSQSNGEWHLGNVSLKLSQDTAFSPDSISFITTMPTILGNDVFNFKFEFYDLNNNYVPVFVTQSATFVGAPLTTNIDTNAIISSSVSQSTAILYAASSSISGTMTTYSSSASSSILTLSSSVSTSVLALTGSISSSLSSSFGFTSSSVYTLSSSVSSSIAKVSSSISQSVYQGLLPAFTKVQQLADGNYSGSFISGNIIYAPVIGGQLGYFSTLFKVGQSPNSIYLDARQTPRKIFIGGAIPGGDTEYSGAYNNPNTNVYLDSSGKFSLTDKLSFDGTNLSVNGTINVTGGNAATNGSLTSSLSSTLSSAQSTALSYASGAVNSLAAGNWTGGGTTFISANSIYSPIIQANAGYIAGVFKVGSGGITLDGGNKKIYIGTGNYNNTDTGFYVDNNSNFSLKDKLTWDGSTLSITGNINIAGGNAATNSALTSSLGNKYDASNPSGFQNNGDAKTGGSVGGWAITSTQIQGGTISGGGDGSYTTTGIRLGSGGWISAKNFYIDSSGNASFRGNITATGGTFNGYLTVGSNNMKIGTDVSGTDDGIYIDANNYWVDSGGDTKFKFGTSTTSISYDSGYGGPLAYASTGVALWVQSNAGTSAGLYVYDGGMQANNSRSGQNGGYAIRTGGTQPNLYVGGEIRATGNIIAYYSDERLKTKLSNINNAVDKLSQLNGFYYKNNEIAKSFGYTDEKTQLGLSAQEVQSVFPDIVNPAPFDTEDVNGGSKSGENYLTIDYSKLVPVLVEAIKELKAEIEELKKNK